MIRKMLPHTLVALALSVVFTCCWVWFLNWPSGRIIHSWAQPQEIEYERNSKYALYIREKAPDWYLLGGRQRRYEIFLSRDGSYGHWFDCTFHGDEQFVRRSTVEWTEKGVTLKQESGHEVFIPKKAFIGGR